MTHESTVTSRCASHLKRNTQPCVTVRSMPAMFNNELKATIQHNAAVTEIKAMFLYYLKWITDDNSL